jgi:hypothetical protein
VCGPGFVELLEISTVGKVTQAVVSDVGHAVIGAARFYQVESHIVILEFDRYIKWSQTLSNVTVTHHKIRWIVILLPLCYFPDLWYQTDTYVFLVLQM